MTTPRQLRRSVAEAITTSATDVRPWHEVELAPDLYESQIPELGEAEAHYGFAVWPGESTGEQAHRGAVVCTTRIQIIFSRILGAQSQVEDSDAGLDDEQAILSVVLALRSGGRNPILRDVRRNTTSGESSGLFIGRILVDVIHQYDLSRESAP